MADAVAGSGFFGTLVFGQFHFQFRDALVQLLNCIEVVVVQIPDDFVFVDRLYGGLFVEDDLVAVQAVVGGVVEQDMLGGEIERFTGQINVKGLVPSVQVDLVVENVTGSDGFVVLAEMMLGMTITSRRNATIRGLRLRWNSSVATLSKPTNLATAKVAMAMKILLIRKR